MLSAGHPLLQDIYLSLLVSTMNTTSFQLTTAVCYYELQKARQYMTY